MSEQTLESAYDKADLFDFCCALMEPGELFDWFDALPDDQFIRGGRAPETKEEAAESMRRTRKLAAVAGLWDCGKLA